MDKRGFPAACILAVLVGIVLLFVMLIKRIYRQLDIIDQRRRGSTRASTIMPHCQQQSSRTRMVTYSRVSINPVSYSSRMVI
jgi:MFS superfamily sulfate permease-like transporter